ncbi:CPBP family intramembrane metalloprotease [Limosilactobacillus sp. Sa3CUN2]|uniref:CPBP family intramembrane metalloprotease n=1 Tax=Limosilactobacillus avistercoris TaxID=2762243 RepID=A0ABR8PB08_9LACO|nr:CPBP family intramembrane glutamic endopeptidase [Limosilactobacillus avistercoris]MBD7894485.1 CPBP family intramembrane metalloprotease [Limosilactobacillus avistercoris]
MTGRDYLKIWYRVQIGATLIILMMMMIRNFELGRNIWLQLLWMVIILGLGLAEELWEDVPPIISKVNCWIQGLAQPVILTFAWGVITREIITMLHMPSRGVVLLMILYYFVMYAPFASVIGGQMNLSIERFIFVIWMFQIVIVPFTYLPFDLIANPKLTMLLSTGAVGAVAYFLFAVTVMRAWHLSWPGLKPNWSSDFNWWILLLMLAIFVIPLGSNMIAIVHLPKTGLFKLTCQAFESGLAEESLFRFALLGVLFYAWRNVKQRLPLAIITSSLLFGFAHLINLRGQRIDLTLYQVALAFLLGLFLSVVYVYTGQLWLTMLMHFSLDWFGFLATGTTMLTGDLVPADWWGLLILLVIFGGFSLWMMFGTRREVMERHVRRLTGKHQRFGFSIQY